MQTLVLFIYPVAACRRRKGVIETQCIKKCNMTLCIFSNCLIHSHRELRSRWLWIKQFEDAEWANLDYCRLTEFILLPCYLFKLCCSITCMPSDFSCGSLVGSEISQVLLKRLLCVLSKSQCSARSAHKDWVAKRLRADVGRSGPAHGCGPEDLYLLGLPQNNRAMRLSLRKCNQILIFFLCYVLVIVNAKWYMYYYYILRETDRALFWPMSYDGFLACLTFSKQACDTPQCTEFNYYTYHILLYVWVCVLVCESQTNTYTQTVPVCWLWTSRTVQNHRPWMITFDVEVDEKVPDKTPLFVVLLYLTTTRATVSLMNNVSNFYILESASAPQKVLGPTAVGPRTFLRRLGIFFACLIDHPVRFCCLFVSYHCFFEDWCQSVTWKL